VAKITVDEVMQELAKRQDESKDGEFSTKDVARSLNVSQRTAWMRLTRWVEEGKVRYVRDRDEESIDKRRITRPVYEVVDQKGKKK